MFGFFDDLGKLVGRTVGVAGGIAIAPLAIALGVTETAVRTAIDAGGKTVGEIQVWLEHNRP